MHDDLPVSLFSLDTFVTLAAEEPSYLSYFLPFCLLNAGLSERQLSLEERINFFEVAFYYILGYLAELQSTKAVLPNHKSVHNTHVRLFPEELTWKRMVAILGVGGNISGRRSCYGKVVEVILKISPCVLNMNPREIAAACHIAYSLPLSSAELDVWNMNYIAVNSQCIINSFVSSMSFIYKRLYPAAKSIPANSRSILVRPGNNHISAKQELKT